MMEPDENLDEADVEELLLFGNDDGFRSSIGSGCRTEKDSVLFRIDSAEDDEDDHANSFSYDLDEDDSEAFPEIEDDKQKSKRVGVSAVAGGVTGALLSVPLVAVDVTVLAVAGPLVVAGLAGGAAIVAAGNPKDLLQNNIRRAREGVFVKRSGHRNVSDQDNDGFMNEETKEEMEQKNNSEGEKGEGEKLEGKISSTACATTRPSFKWVQGVFQRKSSKREQKDDSIYETVKDQSPDNGASAMKIVEAYSPGNVPVAPSTESNANLDTVREAPTIRASGLGGSAMFWIMAQKESEKRRQISKRGESSLDDDDNGNGKAPVHGEAAMDKERKPTEVTSAEQGRRLFEWVGKLGSKSRESEAAVMTNLAKSGSQDDMTVDTTSENDSFDIPGRGWIPPALARRLYKLEYRDETEGSEYDLEDDGEKGIPFDADGLFVYDDKSEEEVTFDYLQDESTPRTALFADDDIVR